MARTSSQTSGTGSRDPLIIPIKPRADAESAPAENKKGKAGSAKAPAKKFRKYDSYLVEYYDGSQRKRVRRSSYPKAMVLIESLKNQISERQDRRAAIRGARPAYLSSGGGTIERLEAPCGKGRDGRGWHRTSEGSRSHRGLGRRGIRQVRQFII